MKDAKKFYCDHFGMDVNDLTEESLVQIECMESYAKEMTREAWVEIRRDWKCKIKFDRWYNEWMSSN